MASGEAWFFQRAQQDVVTIDEDDQRVGVLTEAPAVTLDVRGDVSACNVEVPGHVIAGGVVQGSNVLALADVVADALVQGETLNTTNDLLIRGASVQDLCPGTNEWAAAGLPFTEGMTGFIDESWIKRPLDAANVIKDLYDLAAAGVELYALAKALSDWLNGRSFADTVAAALPAAMAGALAGAGASTLLDSLSDAANTGSDPSNSNAPSLRVHWNNLNGRPLANSGNTIGVKGDLVLSETSTIKALDNLDMLPDPHGNLAFTVDPSAVAPVSSIAFAGSNVAINDAAGLSTRVTGTAFQYGATGGGHVVTSAVLNPDALTLGAGGAGGLTMVPRAYTNVSYVQGTGSSDPSAWTTHRLALNNTGFLYQTQGPGSASTQPLSCDSNGRLTLASPQVVGGGVLVTSKLLDPNANAVSDDAAGGLRLVPAGYAELSYVQGAPNTLGTSAGTTSNPSTWTKHKVLLDKSGLRYVVLPPPVPVNGVYPSSLTPLALDSNCCVGFSNGKGAISVFNPATSFSNGQSYQASSYLYLDSETLNWGRGLSNQTDPSAPFVSKLYFGANSNGAYIGAPAIFGSNEVVTYTNPNALPLTPQYTTAAPARLSYSLCNGLTWGWGTVGQPSLDPGAGYDVFKATTDGAVYTLDAATMLLQPLTDAYASLRRGQFTVFKDGTLSTPQPATFSGKVTIGDFKFDPALGDITYHGKKVFDGIKGLFLGSVVDLSHYNEVTQTTGAGQVAPTYNPFVFDALGYS